MSKNSSKLLIAILLVAVIAGIAVVGSMFWIGLDAAKDPQQELPSEKTSDPSGVTSKDTSSESEFSSDLPSDEPSDVTSGKSSDKPSGTTSEKTSEKTSGGTSEKTSGKTSEKNPSGEGDTYIPFRPTEKVIAITLDDGPSRYTDIVLDKIEGTGDHVTFFVIGEQISETAHFEKTIQREYDLGCEIGNHTYSHVNIKKLSESEWKEQLQKTDDALKAVIGVGTSIMRPPGGNYLSDVDYGYANIMWEDDTEDWKKYGEIRKGNLTKEEVIDLVYDEIVDQAHTYGSGTIVLIHDLYETSALAFCKAYDTLKAEGWKFVTVSELLQIQGREKNLKPYVFYSARNAWLYGKRVTIK